MTDRVPGARWLRCDLHVHTPFDGEKRFGEDLRSAIEALKKQKPQRLAEIADRFVQACRDANGGDGLDLVALTDHNSIEGYRYLKPQFETLSRQATDQGLPMPAILPGVEFSVGGERPIHFLVIFAGDTEADVIDRAIAHVFGASDRFDRKAGTPRATGESVQHFLQQLYDFCRPTSGDRDLEFVVLPAHADGRQGISREVVGGAAPSATEITVATSLWDEMKGNLRQRVITRKDWHGFQTARPFASLPQAFKELLWRWAASKRGQEWDELTEGQRSRFKEHKHWALVECSDPHCYEAIGSRFTWLKMEVPDIEGIRLALLDPESRLRRMADSPPTQRYTRIERARVRGTDFFDDIDLPLSPCLTTLIGGRGSGKSTLVEYLRHAVDRNRREDFAGDGSDEIRANVEKALASKGERDFGETPGTLLPRYEISLDLVVAERRYRIVRTAQGSRLLENPDTPGEAEVPLDVRSLLAPRILSQRQIARIARDPASQRVELDALLERVELADILEQLRVTREEITQLQGKRARLKQRFATLPGRKTELRKTEDQVAFLEHEGREDVLARYQGFEQERSWFDSALSELEAQARSLEVQASGARAAAAQLPSVPTSVPSQTWIESVRGRLVQQLEETASKLSDEAAGLRSLATTISSEQTDQWRPAYDASRAAYETLRDEMRERGVDFTQHERLLQQRMSLTREVAELEAIGGELDRVATEIRIARSDLAQVHERRLALRRQRAKALEDLDADVRLEVLPFRDRKDFESRRDEWFAGAGVQERDWVTLVNYVFALNGSVPDRIQSLVEAWRADVERAAENGRAGVSSESRVVQMLAGDGSLTGNFLNSLERGERLRLDEMERFLPEDAVELRVRSAEGSFTPITTGSVGQRSTAILSLLLSAGDQPLIIDQPEDDLDNRYIYDVVVSLLRQRKFSRQIIIATHNANIPVNGDAELIVALGVEGRLGRILVSGSLDRPEVKEQVSVIMEGSAEAFRLRRERYGY